MYVSVAALICYYFATDYITLVMQMVEICILELLRLNNKVYIKGMFETIFTNKV